MTTTYNTQPKTVEQHLAQWEPFLVQQAIRYARRFNLDPFDLAQDFRVAAIQYFDGYSEDRGRFSTWFGWVMRSTVSRVAQLRDHHNVQAVCSLDASMRAHDLNGDTLDDTLTDHSSPDPANEAARREKIADVRDAINALPEEQREAVISRFWGDARLSEVNNRALREALHALAGSIVYDEEEAA
jgi:RNA polymerase sigma factor (sigma-70 family)